MELLLANWRALLGAVLGAVACWPVASCHGEGKGAAKVAAQVEAAAERVKTAAAKAEAAANLADAARRATAAEGQRQLKEIADVHGTNDAAGAGVRAVLDSLHQRSARNGNDAAR